MGTSLELDPLDVLSEASRGGVSGIAAASVRIELVSFLTANRLDASDLEPVGRLLATPAGRKLAWPWATDLKRSVSVSFLRDRDGSWSRLVAAMAAAGNGAVAPPPNDLPPPPPVVEVPAGTVASMADVIRSRPKFYADHVAAKGNPDAQ